MQVSQLICGVDEAGRGPLAGSVYAAAVILNPSRPILGLADSKNISEKKRNALSIEIKQHALAWAIASCSAAEIDQINILQASFLAMERAIQQLPNAPEHLLIDGNRWKSTLPYPYTCVIKGDGKFASIAAASILAKTYRDEYMYRIHAEHPQYGWDRNKGYGTAIHRNALEKYGITPHHRRSFQILPEQTPLF